MSDALTLNADGSPRRASLADPAEPLSLRHRLSNRLFGGVSGGVFRGMATLALGSGVGQLVAFAAIPVLTRIYTPADFGVLAVFTALVAILAPLVTLRYVIALPLPRHDGVAMNLLVLCVGLMLALTGLLAILLWVWGDALLRLVSMEVLAPWWWLIALGVLGTAAYELLTMWATRKRAFPIIARTSVTQAVAGTCVKIGMGLAGFQPLGLLLGQVVAQAGGIGTLLRGLWLDFERQWRQVRATRMQQVAWKHRGFPIWRVPSQLMLVLSMQAPMLFVAAIYDAGVTGQFGLAVMALSLPANIVGQAVSKALYGEAAAIIKQDPAQISQICIDMQVKMFLLGTTPVIFLYFFGEHVFVVFFGAEWRMAGNVASILIFSVLFQFTSAPLIQVLNVFVSQFYLLVINFVRLIFLISIFYVTFVFQLSFNFFIIVYTLLLSIFYIFVSTHIFLYLKSLK